MTVITPTVGRIVWFWDNHRNPNDAPYQPEAAIVTCVHSDRMVNLCVFDPNGNPRPVTSVELRQEGDPEPELHYMHCRWMPYQVKQAESHRMQEQLARAIEGPSVSDQQTDQHSL